MKSIVRFRWAILVIWLVLAVGLVTQSPNMESLVREKGQINVPDGYPSSIAADIIEEHKPDEEGTSAVIAIFHDEEKLSDSQISAIEKTLMRVEGKKESLKVKEVTTHFNEEELEDQFVSKDGTTIISLLEVQMSDFEVAEVRKKLKGELKTNNVDVLMTGSSFINEDVVVSSQEGLKKTEYLTVGFILVVLILVFRSVVAPLIPLVTVGISYVVSQSIVAFLVDQLNFPLSNFTQIFMVAVLFGIGTDYCILLLSRFKEELSHGEETIPAIIRTYKTAGKTVFFSGIAVLIGFASIGFAEFKLYQSAVAVAIGVGVLLIALVTIVPFFMATMKKALFWPIKGEMSHPKSKLWGWAGRLAIGKPLLALVLVAVVTVPFLLMYKGTLSYNSLDEIGDSYESVRAFNIVSDKFGPGETLPVQIVLENDESMKSQDYLVLIEKISQNLSAIDQVDKIRSATRPAGEVIEDLYVTNQVEEVEEGLGEGTKGIREIEKGLSEAADSIEKSAPE
ncbi:MAG TPA: MMPL family transporter, partial [Chondromyces sp.]|nr:MMPL family transporter [Chondromyces sp.]